MNYITPYYGAIIGFTTAYFLTRMPYGKRSGYFAAPILIIALLIAHLTNYPSIALYVVVALMLVITLIDDDVKILRDASNIAILYIAIIAYELYLLGV